MQSNLMEKDVIDGKKKIVLAAVSICLRSAAESYILS